MTCLPPPPAPASFAAQGLSVRDATPDDDAFLQAVYIAGRWAEMAITGWPEQVILAFLQDQYRLQGLHYAAHYDGAAHLILERDDTTAGKLILHATNTEIRIVDIGLLPTYRSQGIGSMLIRWTQEMARHAGSGKVSLHVEPGNPAKRLYLRLGFQVMATIGIHELLEWNDNNGTATSPSLSEPLSVS